MGETGIGRSHPDGSPDAGAPRVRQKVGRRTAAGLTAIAALVLGSFGSWATAAASDVRFSGGLTLVGQTADREGVDDSLTGSLDLFVTAESGPGAIELYVEGNTTPSPDGVAAMVPEVNGDAGTALDGEGRGRLQVSELKYDIALPGGSRLALGLIDLTAYIDTTRINNDENLQFLSAALINNPVIEVPDYTLGVVFRRPGGGGVPEVHAAVSSSNGLADNPEASYSELFDVGAADKGVFAAVESGWTSDRNVYRIGLWFNGRSHRTIRAGSPGRSNTGVWASAERRLGSHAVNLRLGASDPEVSAGDRFVSLAYQWDRGRLVLGLALAGLHASDDLEAAEDVFQFESYLSVRLAPGLFLTPSFQNVWNTGLDPSPESDRTSVFGLRLHKVF